jgi:hypothetical protein
MVLNGAKLGAVGAQYGIGAERVRQIVWRCVALSSREFCKKHLMGLGLLADTQSVYRKHKRYLIPRIQAGVSPPP